MGQLIATIAANWARTVGGNKGELEGQRLAATGWGGRGLEVGNKSSSGAVLNKLRVKVMSRLEEFNWERRLNWCGLS